ncbi:MAG: hypothetical protein QOH37_345 [Nocardioidaceae bacterium]|nr:hypothetical protein [Nocardioidaceae bacterium]
MSIHDLARAASEDLRSHTAADVDAGLGALHVAHTRRQRRSRATAALVVAAVAAAAWWGGAGFGHHDTTPDPAPPRPTPGLQQPVCSDPMVTCDGHRTYDFALQTPVTWHIPRGYGVNSGAGATVHLAESYAHSGSAGVSVLEGVVAASPASLAAPGVPATPGGFIHWLAARPYLRATSLRRTTIDGRPAWQVRVAVRPHHGHGPGRCATSPSGQPCHPVTFQDGAVTGIWGDMTAEYTAFDLPVSGTAVVWSWAFGHDTRALTHNQTVVRGLSWPSG